MALVTTFNWELVSGFDSDAGTAAKTLRRLSPFVDRRRQKLGRVSGRSKALENRIPWQWRRSVLPELDVAVSYVRPEPIYEVILCSDVILGVAGAAIHYYPTLAREREP